MLLLNGEFKISKKFSLVQYYFAYYFQIKMMDLNEGDLSSIADVIKDIIEILPTIPTYARAEGRVV